MSRLAFRFCAGLVVAALGCSTHKTCDDDSRHVGSQTLYGSRVFSSEGERESVPLRVRLAGLSKRSPEAGMEDAGLIVVLVSGYGDAPADGTVEMPRIAASLDGERLGETPPYPGASGVGFTGAPFHGCRGDACCSAGECSATMMLAIEREQGEPFPPVDVSWSFYAWSNVEQCALAGAEPTLELEVLEP